MKPLTRRQAPALAVLGALVLFFAAPARAQAIVKVNDDVFMRLGFQLQAWGDWQQDTTPTAGYAQNLYLRRVRFLLAGQTAKDVSFFFQTDDPNLGKSTQTVAGGAGGKSLGTGFIVQDAYLEWAIANEFRINGGLILIPLCRNCNSSAVNLVTMDYGTWSFQESASTQSSVGRDTGFQAKGYLGDDHLEYRAGVYSGFRAPGVKNSFRYSGRLQYDVFDVEKVQFYPGTYFGKKKILAIGAGYDAQSDYSAYAGDIFFDFPVGQGNGITAQADYIHYDGGTTFGFDAPAATKSAALYKQNDIYAEAGFFIGSPKVMPFIRYEQQKYADDVNKGLNRTNYAAGFGWYPYGSNFNIKAGYTRREAPDNLNVASTNQYTVQVQVFYY